MESLKKSYQKRRKKQINKQGRRNVNENREKNRKEKRDNAQKKKKKKLSAGPSLLEAREAGVRRRAVSRAPMFGEIKAKGLLRGRRGRGVGAGWGGVGLGGPLG